jgi:hypothetical protein
MSCNAIQERLIAALDSGIPDPEADQHCQGCSECRQAREQLSTLLIELDTLPQPSSISGSEFASLLSLENEPVRETPTLGQLFRNFWGQQPALFFGALVVCILIGYSIPREQVASNTPEDQTNAFVQLSTDISDLKETMALLQLQQPTASERLQGVQWLETHGQSNQGLVDALQLVVATDESTNVRLAAIDAMARLTEGPNVTRALRDALRQPQSPLVRIALIEKLVPFNEPKSTEIFQALVNNPTVHQAVRDRARTALGTSI